MIPLPGWPLVAPLDPAGFPRAYATMASSGMTSQSLPYRATPHMPTRYAIYFAPARESALGQAAEAWLARPELAALTLSARRYGFHATLKAPMSLSGEFAELETGIETLAMTHRPVELSGLAPRLNDGFVALICEPQPKALTDFAADVVTALEPMRQPLSASERERRLKAPLTPRQIELVDQFGYPYVLDQFLFHMTLSDRLPAERREDLLAAATDWFAPALSETVLLDRLVIFDEPEPGAAFRRLDPDFLLLGA
ncbi:MAG: DUF1045 domain-containing protein [Hyphomicrobiales bacterium]|nr:MAG: DUF1045 domain-containing protein [Hyphomicrobiales bacterium]